MSIFLWIILIIVLALLILNAIAPKEFSLERGIVVNVPKEKTYDVLRSLKNQKHWSVWGSKDPNMKTEYRGADGEVGSVYFWSGNKDVGEGEQEITKLNPTDRIESELRFLRPWKTTNQAWFNLEEVESGTKVSWGFAGKATFPFNIMMLFMNMDKTVGKDFEQGMANFKEYIEA